MTKIYLIRHGQTAFNEQGIISGQIETDLTELGRRQASEGALKLKDEGVHFDLILCSPLKRTKDTAKIIADVLPAPIVFDKDLQEFNNGIYEGIKLEDLKKVVFNPPYKTAGFEFKNGTELYEAYSSFAAKFDTLSYPKGETKAQARSRFMNAIKKHLDTPPNINNLAVVAHGAVIRFMILKICPETLIEKIKNVEARVVFYQKDKGFYSR